MEMIERLVSPQSCIGEPGNSEHREFAADVVPYTVGRLSHARDVPIGADPVGLVHSAVGFAEHPVLFDVLSVLCSCTWVAESAPGSNS